MRSKVVQNGYQPRPKMIGGKEQAMFRLEHFTEFVKTAAPSEGQIKTGAKRARTLTFPKKATCSV